MTKEEIRLKCLEFASNKDPNPVSALAAAEIFYSFCMSEAKPASTKSPPIEAEAPVADKKSAAGKKSDNPK